MNDVVCWPSQDTVAPLAARELNGKRKRERAPEGEDDGNKTAGRGEEEEEENVCPNGTAEKTTPVRKVRGQTKGSQKLFTTAADAKKTKRTGERGTECCFGRTRI